MWIAVKSVPPNSYAKHTAQTQVSVPSTATCCLITTANHRQPWVLAQRLSGSRRENKLSFIAQVRKLLTPICLYVLSNSLLWMYSNMPACFKLYLMAQHIPLLSNSRSLSRAAKGSSARNGNQPLASQSSVFTTFPTIFAYLISHAFGYVLGLAL